MTPEEGYREAEKIIASAQQRGGEYLYLSELQLTKIPPQIVQLTQLQWLDLSNNQIVEIPETITQLCQLRRLYLNNNKIVKIP